MWEIWYSILSYHRRKKYLLWLIIIVSMILLSLFFFGSISLGETWYIYNHFSIGVIEIIGLFFVLFFGSTILHQLRDTKILHLLQSKKKDNKGFIGWVILWLITIVLLYTSIAYGIRYILFWGELAQIFLQRTGTSMILIISSSIVLLFSTLTSPYLAFMVGLIIYGISYSIDFIIYNLENSAQNTNIIVTTTIHSIKYLFPRFDLLTIPSTTLAALVWHSIYFTLLCLLITLSFSIRYTASSWKFSQVSTHDWKKRD